ncbi:microtubule-associated protein tau isoform X3 [Trichoplusia ni]|uniref:Microtubule-associated protein n=1 Tax=Trichoplusia ni TaxID=7111 RepID=A0A7E5VSZ3_TRINI|nr:microtubule-associated protein tau isoform X3 [Trichoplusia ni]XP_026731464.1 microtubule-associated protein tau isoform X3 [Trichoplusia ni]
MDTNGANRAPAETRPLSSGLAGQDQPVSPQAPPPLRPLTRVDSRSAFPSPQTPRPVAPQLQARPQFQPGGPVTTPQQFPPRVGVPPPRGPAPAGPPGAQQVRPVPPPLRPFGPQSIAPQQGPRPLQSPTALTAQRAPPPNNLQFGPRQPPIVGATTPDAGRPLIAPQQSNGAAKNGPPLGPGVQRQSSQSSLKGLDTSNSYQPKPVNLENQSFANDTQNVNKTENGIEGLGATKGRSFSIAAAPGAPSPLKTEDDRRKSVSAIGGRIDDFTSRSPGLGLIQEGKLESKENVRESKESIRSDTMEGAKEVPDRPESRLSGSKMTESFIGALPSTTLKKKIDDDDDVILQNSSAAVTKSNEISKPKEDLSDRSPSLTRSDDSPEPKQKPSPSVPNKSQSATPEPTRPKTPKIETKPETKDVKPAVTPNKTPSKSPIPETKPPLQIPKKPSELNTPIASSDSKKSTPRKTASAPKSRPKDGDNDSGVDESTQGNDVNGSPGSPNKKIPSKLPMKEKSSNSLKTSLSRSSSKSATAKTPENPPPCDKKKVPMNKVQVGNAPSPNIKAVKSKIGSLDNATYKPGGGKVRIENRKLEFGNVTPKIAAKNEAYTPSGGVKKIVSTKLEWNAKSKIGSLQNTAYKPGGGDKKIETVKLDFKEKAKPKVASTVNITHKPGGGAIKSTVTKNGTRAIENQKLEFKAQSKVGSMDNVKHKPGGGDIKIFDDKDYIKQMTGHSPLPDSHGHSRQEPEYLYTYY